MLAARWLIVPILAALGGRASAASDADLQLEKLRRRIELVDVAADVSSLTKDDQAALAELIRAGKVLDAVFMKQEWSGNFGMLRALVQDYSPEGRARLAYFLRMRGPWDRGDGSKPFVPGAPLAPQGGDFYPTDVTSSDVVNWLKTLTDKGRAEGESPFTVIRWVAPLGLNAMPYALLYENEFNEVTTHLRLAASRTKDPALKAYLSLRADSFFQNDFSSSNEALMGLDAPIVANLGPSGAMYDLLFHRKSAFGSFIVLRDDRETAKASALAAQMSWLLKRLPAEFSGAYKGTGRLPVFIGNLLFASGADDVEPNLVDNVVEGADARSFIMENIVQAHFDDNIRPVAKEVLGPDLLDKLDPEAFLDELTMSQLIGAFGEPKPAQAGEIPPDALETFWLLAYTRGSAAGPWGLQQLIDKGVLDKSLEPRLYAAYLAWLLKLARDADFGGRSASIQLNFLLEHGGLLIHGGRFEIAQPQLKQAVAALMATIIDIDVRIDAKAAKDLRARLGALRPDAAAALDRTRGLPVDIGVRDYITARELASRP